MQKPLVELAAEEMRYMEKWIVDHYGPIATGRDAEGFYTASVGVAFGRAHTTPGAVRTMLAQLFADGYTAAMEKIFPIQKPTA